MPCTLAGDVIVSTRIISSCSAWPWTELLILCDAGTAFLGGTERQMFVPSPMLPQSVLDATRMAFRFPPGTRSIDDALLGLRYIQSLLGIGERHGLISPAGVHCSMVSYTQSTMSCMKLWFCPDSSFRCSMRQLV